MLKNTDLNKQSLIHDVMPRFCGNCSFLNITEEEQNKQKKVLLHNGYHPKIPVLAGCDYNEA